MRQPLQAIIRSNVVAPRAAIATFGAPGAGTISGVSILHTGAGADDLTFDVLLNSVSIFETEDERPTIAAGQDFVTLTDLGAIVRELAVITVDLTEGNTTGVLFVQVIAEDSNAESLSLSRVICDAYRGALAREPEEVELGDALSTLALAGTESYISFLTEYVAFISGLFDASEYTALARTDAEFVEDLYRAILARPSDEDGYNTWLTALGTHTRAFVLNGFLFSAEFYAERVKRAYPYPDNRVDAGSIFGISLPAGNPAEGETILYHADGTFHYGEPGGALPELDPDPSGVYTNPTSIQVDEKGRVLSAESSAGVGGLAVTPLTLDDPLNNLDLTYAHGQVVIDTGSGVGVGDTARAIRDTSVLTAETITWKIEGLSDFTLYVQFYQLSSPPHFTVEASPDAASWTVIATTKTNLGSLGTDPDWKTWQYVAENLATYGYNFIRVAWAHLSGTYWASQIGRLIAHGFLLVHHLPLAGSDPADTPTTISGYAPLRITTDGKLWAYYGGAWHHLNA